MPASNGLKPTGRSRKRKPLRNQVARIGWLADQKRPDEDDSQQLTVDSSIIERVRKCNARANHPNANEAEMRAAVRMAKKIMDLHKFKEADIMATEVEADLKKRGGRSTVGIWPAKDGADVISATWVNDMACAMCKFFDCNSFSERLDIQIEWTFYGIVEHTVSAAMAFEMVHNLIQRWAEEKHSTVAGRNSYSLGVACGLCRMAEEERVEMENVALASEQRALATKLREEEIRQQAELYRLRFAPPPPNEADASEPEDFDGDPESEIPDAKDDISDNEVLPDFDAANEGAVDTTNDFEAELQKFIVPDKVMPSIEEEDMDIEPPIRPPTPPTEAPEEETETAQWKSMRQLTTFREQSKCIETEVLKDLGVKLRKGRKAKRSIKDARIYRQGKLDARDINVKAARIEEERGVNGMGDGEGEGEAKGSATPHNGRGGSVPKHSV